MALRPRYIHHVGRLLGTDRVRITGSKIFTSSGDLLTALGISVSSRFMFASLAAIMARWPMVSCRRLGANLSTVKILLDHPAGRDRSTTRFDANAAVSTISEPPAVCRGRYPMPPTAEPLTEADLALLNQLVAGACEATPWRPDSDAIRQQLAHWLRHAAPTP
jgi:hypothetical protein